MVFQMVTHIMPGLPLPDPPVGRAGRPDPASRYLHGKIEIASMHRADELVPTKLPGVVTLWQISKLRQARQIKIEL